jgi:chromosome partitioning protein
MRLVLIDADPTEAISRWATNAYEGPRFETLRETDETRLAHLIGAKEDSADLVVVDTAGFGNRAATVAMTSADVVIIPSLAGEADITEAEKTVRLVQGLAKAARREIPALVLFNRVRKTTLSRHAARELAAAGVKRLNSALSDFVAYGEMTYSGQVPTTGLAAVEIAGLLTELAELGWTSKKLRVAVET